MAACWYPGSKMYTPLIAMRGDFAALVKSPKELKSTFSSLIGNREAVWLPKKSETDEPKLKYLPMLPVLDSKVPAGFVGYEREVGGRYGLYPANKSKTQKKLGSKRFFRVKVVVGDNVLYFSPDNTLVDRALTTKTGKFPSMASSLIGASSTARFILVPEAFSKLAKASILDSLPSSQESIFRTAVSRQLFPNIDHFGQRPLQAAVISGDGVWKKVDWTTNAIQ